MRQLKGISDEVHDHDVDCLKRTKVSTIELKKLIEVKARLQGFV